LTVSEKKLSPRIRLLLTAMRVYVVASVLLVVAAFVRALS
jgi:hypothetical protein